MPRLWKRADGCLIIKGIIHNKDEDNCTWQVDDARNTVALLNAHDIDTSELPVKFPLALVVKLKRRRWISTENNASGKTKTSKVKLAATKAKKQSRKKSVAPPTSTELARLGFNRKMFATLSSAQRAAVKQLLAQPQKQTTRWTDPGSVTVTNLARQLRVTPLQV